MNNDKRSRLFTNKDDKFFEKDNCDRCGKSLYNGSIKTFTMSWFTDEVICNNCDQTEQELKGALKSVGLNPDDYEGCGYVPSIEDKVKQDTKPLLLCICSDFTPQLNFLNLIVQESGLPKHITDTVNMSDMVIKFRVPTFEEVCEHYKTLLDYLISTDWYLDDTKSSFCSVTCCMWNDDFNDYVDYVNGDGEEFDEIIEKWMERHSS